MEPRIKTYSQIVETAAQLMDMPVLDAEFEMDAKLRELKIPKIAVVLYVNWADWNVLTYLQLAEATGLTLTAVRSHLQTIKRRFKHLFTLGHGQCVTKGVVHCP